MCATRAEFAEERSLKVVPGMGSLKPRAQPSRSGLARSAFPSRQAAGTEVGATAFGGWVPSALRRFLPLAVFLTCLAEMVLLPTRFFFASAISILLSKEAEDTGGTDTCLIIAWAFWNGQVACLHRP